MTTNESLESVARNGEVLVACSIETSEAGSSLDSSSGISANNCEALKSHSQKRKVVTCIPINLGNDIINSVTEDCTTPLPLSIAGCNSELISTSCPECNSLPTDIRGLLQVVAADATRSVSSDCIDSQNNESYSVTQSVDNIHHTDTITESTLICDCENVYSNDKKNSHKSYALVPMNPAPNVSVYFVENLIIKNQSHCLPTETISETPASTNNMELSSDQVQDFEKIKSKSDEDTILFETQNVETLANLTLITEKSPTIPKSVSELKEIKHDRKDEEQFNLLSKSNEIQSDNSKHLNNSDIPTTKQNISLINSDILLLPPDKDLINENKINETIRNGKITLLNTSTSSLGIENSEIKSVKQDEQISEELLNPQNIITENSIDKYIDDNDNDDINDSIYEIKWIRFHDKNCAIITQNQNGPCPIIAIANVLLLRGSITLSEDNELISGSRLLQLITELLLSKTPQNLNSEQLGNYMSNVSDAFYLLPNLQTGLDVNIRFTGVSDFEFTPSLSLFDLFNIHIYHGWLVDPDDQDLYLTVGNRTYNQLVEELIRLQSSKDPSDINKGLLVESFLQQSASQLTFHGLVELCNTLKDRELAVLFRNNHFNTILKYKDAIYVLVTDMGLLNEPRIVWEILNDLGGDTQFVDSSFKLYTPNESTTNNHTTTDKIIYIRSDQKKNVDNNNNNTNTNNNNNIRSNQLHSSDLMPTNLLNPFDWTAYDYELSKYLQEEEYRYSASLNSKGSCSIPKY